MGGSPQPCQCVSGPVRISNDSLISLLKIPDPFAHFEYSLLALAAETGVCAHSFSDGAYQTHANTWSTERRRVQTRLTRATLHSGLGKSAARLSVGKRELKRLYEDTHTRFTILTTQSKAKAKCDQSYKEISSLKNRADILQTENKALHSQMLLQREELKTFKSNLAFTKSQAAHDVRKKAQELDKMKTRLQKLMNEKSGLKMGMSLVNPLPKASSTVLMDGSKKKETAVSVLSVCTKQLYF